MDRMLLQYLQARFDDDDLMRAAAAFLSYARNSGQSRASCIKQAIETGRANGVDALEVCRRLGIDAEYEMPAPELEAVRVARKKAEEHARIAAEAAEAAAVAAGDADALQRRHDALVAKARELRAAVKDTESRIAMFADELERQRGLLRLVVFPERRSEREHGPSGPALLDLGQRVIGAILAGERMQIEGPKVLEAYRAELEAAEAEIAKFEKEHAPTP